MDTKGFEKKPWFPYLKNMYDKIEGNMMSVDAKGYEEKPWWPYVLDLQEKIDAGGGGGSSIITIAQKQSVTTATEEPFPEAIGSITLADGAVSTKTIDVIFDGVEYKNVPYFMSGYGEMKNFSPDFTNYPFFVMNHGSENQWMLNTATAGSYEIEIKATPTNVPYWNCHVTVTNEKNDTDLLVQGFIVDPDSGEEQIVKQVIGTKEFDVIAADGVSFLRFTNSSGRNGIVTSVTGKGVSQGDGRVAVFGNVTITAKGSE